MIKILSVVIAGLLALWSTHRPAPETAPTSVAVTLDLAKHPLPLHEFAPIERPAEMPRISYDDGAQPQCGFSYAAGVAVAAGEDFFEGPFAGKAAATAWFAVAANRTALVLEMANDLTAHLPCGLCESGNPCGRHVWNEGGGFGGGVAQDPVTGLWYAYVETTGPMTLYVTCLPCPI